MNSRTQTTLAIVLGALAASHPRAAELRQLAVQLGSLTGASVGMLPLGGNQAGAALAGVLPHRGAGGTAVDSVGMDIRAMLARPRKAYVLFGLEPGVGLLGGGRGPRRAQAGGMCHRIDGVRHA